MYVFCFLAATGFINADTVNLCVYYFRSYYMYE